MGTITKLKRLIRNPYLLVSRMGESGMLRWLSDKVYISVCYRSHAGYWMNWNDPQTFNEKIQWLKLYNHRPEYTVMADKVAVKEYVAGKIGSEYIIPTLGIYDNPDDIDFAGLPNCFVLKCNHNSGLGMIICRDKSKLDMEKARKELKRGLRQDYFLTGREWAYKDIPRKIIAEQYMEDEYGELRDYKVFNFNGQPRFIQVDYDRFSGHKRNLYTIKWEFMNAEIEYPSDPNVIIPRPECLEEMLELAKKLSEGIVHVRTDFYIIRDKIYFGELTFYHGSGYEKIVPHELNRKLGELIILPEE